MIKQQESIIQKMLLKLYDYCIMSQVKMLSAEYHLMSDKKIIALLVYTIEEMQNNRINKLLRNINLFIICRSLFGYMGLYNVYGKKKRLKSLKKELSNLSRIEKLHIKAISIVIIITLRCYKNRYYTYANITQLLTSIEEYNQSHANKNTLLPVLLARSVLYSNKACILFDNNNQIKQYNDYNTELFGVSSTYEPNSAYGKYHSMMIDRRVSINVTTTINHATIVTLFNTLHTDYMPIFDSIYLWGSNGVIDRKSVWHNTLSLNTAYFSKLDIVCTLITSMRPTVYARLLDKLYNTYSSHKYMLNKKMPLSIPFDGLTSSVENMQMHMLYNHYLLTLNSAYGNNGMLTYSIPLKTLYQLSNKIVNNKTCNNKISLNDAIYSSFIVNNYDNDDKVDSKHKYYEQNKPIHGIGEVMYNNHQRHNILFNQLYKKYLSIINCIKNNMHKQHIFLVIETNETLSDICTILYNHKIKYKCYSNQNIDTNNGYVLIANSLESLMSGLDNRNSLIIVTECLTNVGEAHSNTLKVTQYVSKEDPLLRHKCLSVDYMEEGCYEKLPCVKYMLENENKQKSNPNTSSSIKWLKYMSVYKGYLKYIMCINYLMNDVSYLTYHHYIHMIKHVITILTYNRLTRPMMYTRVLPYKKLVALYRTDDTLDKYSIPITHIENRKALQKAYVCKRQILSEHIALHVRDVTYGTSSVSFSEKVTLYNLAYVIKSHTLHLIKTSYGNNLYGVFKNHQYDKRNYNDALYNAITNTFVSVFYSMYYNYKNP